LLILYLPAAIEPWAAYGQEGNTHYQVQRAGLAGQNWTTVCRATEARAREIFLRQLRVYSVGRFRLVDPNGLVVEERKVNPLFGDN
jgi:hypothetical protein